MFQMLAQDNILGAPQARKIPSLDMLVPGLAAYFSRDVIDGWLYKRNKDGVLLPWLVHRLRHIVPDQGAPYVVIDLLANTMQAASKEASPDHRMRRSGMTNAIVINANDIANRTIPELLIDQGYFKECAEFKREYEEQSKRFLKYQAQFGAQFIASKSAFIMDEKSRFNLIRIKDGVIAKCVNDEENLDRRFEMSADATFWRESGFEVGFEKIPLHCYMYMFHLELHQDVWVHVQNLTEYQYKPELRDKLILPEHHRDLIDILTAGHDRS